MTEQAVLDVFRLEGFLQERIFLKIDHSKRQIHARPPVGMGFPEFLGTQGRALNRGACFAIGTQRESRGVFECNFRGHNLELLNVPAESRKSARVVVAQSIPRATRRERRLVESNAKANHNRLKRKNVDEVGSVKCLAHASRRAGLVEAKLLAPSLICDAHGVHKQPRKDSAKDHAADVRQISHPTRLHRNHGTHAKEFDEEPHSDEKGGWDKGDVHKNEDYQKRTNAIAWVGNEKS